MTRALFRLSLLPALALLAGCAGHAAPQSVTERDTLAACRDQAQTAYTIRHRAEIYSIHERDTPSSGMRPAAEPDAGPVRPLRAGAPDRHLRAQHRHRTRRHRPPVGRLRPGRRLPAAAGAPYKPPANRTGRRAHEHDHSHRAGEDPREGGGIPRLRLSPGLHRAGHRARTSRARPPRCWTQIDQLLETHGTDKTRLLQAQIWLKDIRRPRGDERDSGPPGCRKDGAPARACVQAELADPRLLVEIMVTACK